MSATIKWIDLRDNTDKARLKVATINSEDGRQRRFLFIVGLSNKSGRWTAAMEKLGFTSSPRGKYLTRMVREGERIQASDFRPVWPNASLAEMSREDVLLDLAPARQARETQAPRTEEEKSVAVEAGTVIRLGRNADGLEVYLSPMGRFVRRDDGVNIQETDLVGPEMFLRAPDNRALGSCADGFVRAMLLGEVQHSDDLDRFLRGVTDREGPYEVADYERAATVVDAALVRYLNNSYETAQDAYGDANRLYDYMPPYKGTDRGKGAVPLPVAVIAQRLLGDTTGKTVLVPNAWDGASFAFLTKGTHIRAFRGDKDLSRHVASVREEDTSWGDHFDPAREQGADGLFFNADPVRDADGAREDYRQALAALRTLNPGARAVLVLAADSPRHPGELKDESRRFLEMLGRRYDVEAAVELGAELQHRVGTETGLRIIAVRNRPSSEHSVRVDGAMQVLHSWDELKTVIDEVIVTIDLREAQAESIDVDQVTRDNEFQRPYIAFSKVGEVVTMVPKNLQGPLQYALSTLEKQYGPIDEFVEREAGFGLHTLGDRFSPEQVDALGLALARLKSGRGIIIGDETGIGKGRVLAGLATWAEKQGKNVLFITDRANLFSDLVRDARDIEEWGRFRPFVMNADGLLVDVFNNEVLHKGTSPKEMHAVLENDTPLEALQKNLVFLTYSQISGEDSPKADWVLSQAERALVIVDEAHVAAGSDSNTSQVVMDLVTRAWGVVYSSATWAKTSENLHVYQRALPETINMASLAATMRTGGEAFSELFSSMLARDGAFIRREHDLSKIEFVVEVDSRTARNSELSDKVAGILAAMTYVGGEINKMLTKLNDDTAAVLKKARASRTASQGIAARGEGKMFRAHFGAGSVLYQVMRRFLAVLNTDHVMELAQKAIGENRKPVIVFEDTGETFTQRLIKERTIPAIEGEAAVLPEAVPVPTIRDLLRNIMKRLGVVTTFKATEADLETAAERRARQAQLAGAEEEIDIEQALEAQDAEQSEGATLTIAELPGVTPEQQQEYEEGMKRILKMIDELPPMPLNAIDVMRARMADAGLRVGEISGRGIMLEAPEAERAESIESERWGEFEWKIVPRHRKKTDVNRTVFEFNNGDLDVLFINRSAATGLSLHSSPRYGDTRRRELLESQIPENPTDRIQLYGRVNRYDQLVTPKITLPTTGIFGEVRQLMMQNKKLARLSANIRSSRENAAEIRFVPDLINPIGEEVARRFLEDNGGVRSRLGISEADMESKSLSLIQRLTSRVALLRVAEQKMVYEELYEMFEDAINRYELAGENPLKAKEMDIRATMKDSRLVIGVEMDGVGSAFDGPVYLKRLGWKEDLKPLQWTAMMELIRKGRQELVDAGHAQSEPYVYPKADLIIPRRARGMGRSRMRQWGLDLTGIEPVADDEASRLADAFHTLAGNRDARAEGDAQAEREAQALREEEEASRQPQDSQLVGVPALALASSDMLAQIHPFSHPRDPQAPSRQADFEVVDDGAPPDEEDLKSGELHANDPPGISLTRVTNKLLTVLEARLRLELLGTKFPSVEAALAATEPNGIKRALARKMWLEKNLPKLVPGSALGIEYAIPHGDGTKSFQRNWAVLVGLHVPPKGKESQLSRWKLDIAFPGDAKPQQMTLAALMEGVDAVQITQQGEAATQTVGSHICDGDLFAYQAIPVWRRRNQRTEDEYTRDRLNDMAFDFDDAEIGLRDRKAYILDGNMYLASEWAHATKQGHGIIYTDDRGLRHRAVLLKSRGSIDLMTHMPVRLWSTPMVAEFLRRVLADHAEHEAQVAAAAATAPAPAPTTGRAGAAAAPARRHASMELLFATSYQGALPHHNSEKGSKVLLLPGKGIAMTLERSDVKRVGRALRSWQKNQLKRDHPRLAEYTAPEREAALASQLKVTTEAGKGKKPLVLIECQDGAGFDRAVDLLCHAAGIELYLPRGSWQGNIADEVQRDYFERRRRIARDQVMGVAARAAETAETGEAGEPAAAPAQACDEEPEAAGPERERMAA